MDRWGTVLLVAWVKLGGPPCISGPDIIAGLAVPGGGLGQGYGNAD